MHCRKDYAPTLRTNRAEPASCSLNLAHGSVQDSPAFFDGGFILNISYHGRRTKFLLRYQLVSGNRSGKDFNAERYIGGFRKTQKPNGYPIAYRYSIIIFRLLNKKVNWPSAA